MNKKIAEEIIETANAANGQTSRKEYGQEMKARGWLEGYAEARKDISVCDCHTWPAIEEMHDYCVALEKKLNTVEKALSEKWHKAGYEDGVRETEKKAQVLVETLRDICSMEKGHDCKCECANHCIELSGETLKKWEEGKV